MSFYSDSFLSIFSWNTSIDYLASDSSMSVNGFLINELNLMYSNKANKSIEANVFE